MTRAWLDDRRTGVAMDTAAPITDGYQSVIAALVCWAKTGGKANNDAFKVRFSREIFLHLGNL
jgi:hypothetical protein